MRYVMPAHVGLVGVLVLSMGAVRPVPARAADDPAKEPAAQSTPAIDPLKEWSELDARKNAIVERAAELQQEFADADDAAGAKIRKELQQLVNEFQVEIIPRMAELAPAVYERAPDNANAGELVINLAMQKNNFQRASQVCEKMIADGHKSELVLNFAGVAAFATHQFDRAVQLFADAKELDDPQEETGAYDGIGARYHEPAGDYVDLWKKEQELRAREESASGNQQLPRVLLQTSRGDVEVVLFENEAPNTVANFIDLVEKHRYDGTRFHRVIPNFMAQGGDLATRDPGAEAEPDEEYTIACECYRDDARKHFRGSLSMAHAGKDTGGTQFFITHLPTFWLNAEINPSSVHTVFGRVVKGMEIVDVLEVDDKIVSAKVISKRKHPYVPKREPAGESG